MQKPLPIGVSDFKQLIEGGYLYVDKTLLIQELVEKHASVLEIPRMRRFGKTLNLSMLHYFFEKSPENRQQLFTSLNIWKASKYRELQGRYPVIFLSLKDVKFSSWKETMQAFSELIASEFRRHKELLEGAILDQSERAIYHKIVSQTAEIPTLARSLLYLSQWLHRHTQQRVILLIDEYDTPAHAAYVGKYYDQMIEFLRNWLSGGLKDNPSLEKGVLTGILRIAKESIFSGLNNISTFTVLTSDFHDKFGLTHAEVEKLLHTYGLSSSASSIEQWYDGYQIGSHPGLYNPWSVLNCIAKQGALAPYWVNTSDNSLMRKLVAKGAEDFKADIEELMRGGVIEKTLEEGIAFPQLEQTPNAVWALLLFSGYLTVAAAPSYGSPCRLRIPNAEMRELYHSMVIDWFEKTLHSTKYRLLLSSLTSGDVDTFSQLFQEFILSSVSVFDVSADEPEKLYHGFVLGLLTGLSDRYEVKSNRESGLGRYDVMLIPKDSKELGIVMEFKKIGSFEKTDLDAAVKSALKQIEEKKYAHELFDRGVKKVLLLGFAFKGKQVEIRSKFARS